MARLSSTGPQWSAIDGLLLRARTSLSLRGRLWTLDYAYGTGVARLGGRRADAGRCCEGVGGVPTMHVCDAHPCDAQCAVCVSVRRKNSSAHGFRASEGVYVRHVFHTNTQLTLTISTDRLRHVSEYHYTHQPKHVYEHVRRLRNAAARPGGYARSRSQACRSVPSLRPLPAHAAPTALRSSPSTGDRLPAVRVEKAHQDGATHQREPQRAALSIATDAQTTRSIDGKQPPPNKHSLGVLAAPRAPHLHEAPHEHGGAAAPTVDEHAAAVPH